jgi:glycosyltransferase involved in cell wall biosynthesis
MVPSISIVIATYNRASLLQATLEQLGKQAYEPGDEVIVVDNGSTDSTPDVIARAAQTFPAALLPMREEEQGKGPALNTGIAAARGSVLALTDDDVVVADDWLSTIRSIFHDASIALVAGRVDPMWDEAPPSWLKIEEDGRYSSIGSAFALQHYGQAQPLGNRTGVGANLAVRTTVVREVGQFVPQLAPRRGGGLIGVEDHEFCRRVIATGFRCEYRPELRVRHWVPAQRLRLWYLLRWFFWSGVAHAILGSDDPIGPDGVRRGIPLYHLRQVFRASISAVRHLVRRRNTDAASSAMDAAFSLGYVAHYKCPTISGRSTHRIAPVIITGVNICATPEARIAKTVK